MVSKTRTGPVLPMMVSGCPENSAYDIPQMAPDNKLSIVDCRRKQKTEIEINSSLLMPVRRLITCGSLHITSSYHLTQNCE